MQGSIRTLRVMAALLPVALAGCATSYQSRGLTGGYSDRRIDDSAYVVTFRGKGGASRDRIYEFWLYRCSELTLSHGYALFAVRQNRPSAQLEPDPAPTRLAVYRGNEGATAIDTTFFLVPVPMPKITDYTYSATVLMYGAPLAPDIVWALDAQKIQAALKPYVLSGDDGQAPDQATVLDSALVAHESVDIGGQQARSEATPMPGDRGLAPLKNPRSVAEVSATLRGAGLIACLTAYHRYRDLNGLAATGGDIRLDFTVRGTGQTIDVRVTASSFADPEFVAAVQAVLSGTEFGARDAADTDLKNFVITFRPQ